MKFSISIILFLIPSFVFGQITFAEVTPPNDFNIHNIKQSPIGEYFTQAKNEANAIYTSMDGENWTKTSLPGNYWLGEMQFYSDGTPILKNGGTHIIRTNGSWSILNIGNSSWYNLPATFIRNDTLYAYHDLDFLFSVDKGVTFNILFTSPIDLVDHSSNLWKFENHIVLHHTAGASDHLTVFNNEGEIVLSEPLYIGIASFIYNSCEELFIYDNSYYVLKADLTLEQGETYNILPENLNSNSLSGAGESYYCKSSDKVYKSVGCGFNWEELAVDDEIMDYEFMSINNQEDIFLFNEKSDFYYKKINGGAAFEEHTININKPWVFTADESIQGQQISSTSNNLFSKNLEDTEWSELSNINTDDTKLQYSPNGNFYTYQQNQVLFSEDNGNTFTPLDMPDAPVWHFWEMSILDDGFIYLASTNYEEDYYTLNNGHDWVEVAAPNSQIYKKRINLVGNFIYVLSLDFSTSFIAKINISTNETIIEEFEDFDTNSGVLFAVTNEGVCHILKPTWAGSENELYQFEFGGELELIESDFPLTTAHQMVASKSEIFFLSHEDIFQIENEELVSIPLIGLPESSSWNPRSYFVTNSDHVYAIFGNSRVYRSTEPLTNGTYISGTVTNDLNQDCLLGLTEAGLQHWKVTVQNSDYTRIKTTNANGYFNFDVPFGDYSVSTQPVSTNWEICDDLFEVTISETETQVYQDFQVKAINDCAALTIDFSTPLLRRCFDNYYSIRVTNTGPAASNGTTLNLQLDEFFDFSDASIPYTQLQDDLLEFDLGILEVNDAVVFRIYFNLSCDADLGAEHCLTGTLLDDVFCNNSFTLTTFTECQENIGSFDPNDKRIFNEAGNETAQIDTSEYIYYHIRFQNTGTDTAFNVKITDAISDKLDINSLEMLSASHEYGYEITDGPTLIVDFENILLPDSTTNEVESHGFFKFKIKPLAEIGYGSAISNQASIFFDFNEAVITNEAVVHIEKIVGTNQIFPMIDFEIYPNPSDAILHLLIYDTDLNQVEDYDIVNHLGQVISSGNLNNQSRVKVSHLTNGVHSILLKENGKIIGAKKFIKL